ncbi:MAG: glycosyltransferase [Planctomycetota bacterium]
MNDNWSIYESQYTGRKYADASGDDYFSSLIRTRLEPILKLPEHSRILDLGCGNGSFMFPLLDCGFEVTGLDYSPAILEELRVIAGERNQSRCSIDLVEGDARDLPFKDDHFDGLLSFAVLYAIQELDAVFSEIHRVLKPGGVAFIDLGNSNSLNDAEALRAGTNLALRHLRPEAMRSLLTAAELQIVDERVLQAFPYWGGGTERALNSLNPMLVKRMARQSRGKMLDELVSSSALAREFGFRYVFTLRKPLANEDFSGFAEPKLDAKTARAWFEAPRVAARDRAREYTKRNRITESVSILCDLIEADPSDFASLVQLAELYEGDREELVAARMRSRLESVIAELGLQEQRGADIPATHDRSYATVEGLNSPLISVVLPTFNQDRYLPRAVSSLLNQTYERFELIVVNDGSTDGTAEYLDRLCDPRLRIIHQENAGLPKALNRGFESSRGEYHTWVSSDNIAAPNFLESLLGALESNPEAGFAASNFAWVDENDKLLRVTQDQDLSYRSLVTLNPGIAAFLYRSKLAQEVGDYEPSLEGAEDWDMWIRLVEQAPAVHVPETLYFYREHQKSMSATMSEKVREASVKVINRAFERQGCELDLDMLYPGLADCSDRDRAGADACFDFGNRLLQSPFATPALAAVFFKTALELAPDSPAPEANLCVALAADGKWDEALSRSRTLAKKEGATFQEIWQALRQAHRAGNPAALSQVPIFQLLGQAEIFQCEKNLVYRGLPLHRS